jgi:hypothetical protein
MNPDTGKCRASCKPDQIRNPDTGRCIKIKNKASDVPRSSIDLKKIIGKDWTITPMAYALIMVRFLPHIPEKDHQKIAERIITRVKNTYKSYGILNEKLIEDITVQRVVASDEVLAKLFKQYTSYENVLFTPLTENQMATGEKPNKKTR